jgi:hypothetical protein
MSSWGNNSVGVPIFSLKKKLSRQVSRFRRNTDKKGGEKIDYKNSFDGCLFN